MFYYIWNGLLIVICIALPVVLMVASNGAQPTFMSCQQMRRRMEKERKKTNQQDDK